MTDDPNTPQIPQISSLTITFDGQGVRYERTNAPLIVALGMLELTKTMLIAQEMAKGGGVKASPILGVKNTLLGM